MLHEAAVSSQQAVCALAAVEAAPTSNCGMTSVTPLKKVWIIDWGQSPEPDQLASMQSYLQLRLQDGFFQSGDSDSGVQA